MNYLKIAIVIFLLLPLSAQSQLNIDDFRGAKWGQTMDEIQFDHNKNPVFIREGKSGPYTIYSLQNENHQMGTAKLKHIHYHFNKNGKFVRVIIEGSDEYNEDIESILANRLPPPDKTVLYQWEVIRTWEDDQVVVIFREQKEQDFVLELNSKVGLLAKMKKNATIDDF